MHDAHDLTLFSGPDSTALLDPAVHHGQAIIGPMATLRDRTRTGGYFTFWRPSRTGDGIPELVVGFYVGTRLSPERIAKYMHFATEKAARLFLRPEDITSFQSRDDSDPDQMKHKYGGAIRLANGLVFSFSGYNEIEDESICVLAARKLGLMEDEYADRIVAASDNFGLRDMIPHMRQRGAW